MAKSPQNTSESVQNYKNIPLDDPTEGVIRSAQLYDKVCPPNSDQLGLNIVYDSIGARTTRKGVTRFGGSLSGPVISMARYNVNSSTSRQLLAQVGSQIYASNGGSYSSVRTMSSSSKCRYAEFLNLLYTVNGSSGDNIQTYDGTSYGSTNVASLPKGDFLSAGFELRVWVADATNDRLYFSDIASPTGVITGGTNYISSLSPQDGESITGLFRHPRALLVFKQNHIYRVFSAYNVDPFPAYNVGTFSQESIVEAKDGVYFHHPSGFYKFEYNSQPTEISLRIIDFIRAIPNANYGNICGAYDGKNHITWSIGPVTVDGVTYNNCQARYTISTQVWTIFDLSPGITPTAMITYDNGDVLCGMIGTSQGGTYQCETGLTDDGQPIYFEYLTRWMPVIDQWGHTKKFTGCVNFHENGAGTTMQYRTDLNLPVQWADIGSLDDNFATTFPNVNCESFNRIQFRGKGTSVGQQVVLAGCEIINLTDLGFREN